MPFPPLKKKPGLFDDPSDDIGQPPHPEPDEDESYVDDIMNTDISAPEGEEGDLFGESPLETALSDAGYQVSPAQLAEIESILSKKPATAKPMGGAKPAPIGGAVPGGMESSDLPMR